MLGKCEGLDLVLWMDGGGENPMAKALFLCWFHHWSAQGDVEEGGSGFSKGNFV